MVHLLVADLFWLSYVFFISSLLESTPRAPTPLSVGASAGPAQP